MAAYSSAHPHLSPGHDVDKHPKVTMLENSTTIPIHEWTSVTNFAQSPRNCLTWLASRYKILLSLRKKCPVDYRKLISSKITLNNLVTLREFVPRRGRLSFYFQNLYKYSAAVIWSRIALK